MTKLLLVTLLETRGWVQKNIVRVNDEELDARRIHGREESRGEKANCTKTLGYQDSQTAFETFPRHANRVR